MKKYPTLDLCITIPVARDCLNMDCLFFLLATLDYSSWITDVMPLIYWVTNIVYVSLNGAKMCSIIINVV